MSREPWLRPARTTGRDLAREGLSRDAIREAVADWIAADDFRVRLAIGSVADKIAADATSSNVAKATPFRPRASTAGGRTPVPPSGQLPSELLADWLRYLNQTAGIVERRPHVHEAVAALQLGLGLWPEMDERGRAGDILAKQGWDADRIALVLGAEAKAA